MRIELSRFDDKGTVSASYLDMSPAEIAEIVRNAHEVSRLRRAGQPYEDALNQLDGAFENVSIKTGPAMPTELAVTPDLVDSYAALRSSSQADTTDTSRVSVSRDALDAVGTALEDAVTNKQTQWKWVSTRRGDGLEVKSQDASAVLQKLSQITRDAGAPNIKEAMANYPIQFCAAFASLVQEEELERERTKPSTTIVNLDNGDGQTMMSVVAPVGMSEEKVRLAVQHAVQTAALKGQDVDGIATLLQSSGFEPVEHMTVEVPPLPRDSDDDEDLFSDKPSPM